VQPPFTSPWGKLRIDDLGRTHWHPLVDHCRDVAACAEALLHHPVTRRRLAALAGVADLSDVWIASVSALALLHDFGKANAGFQGRSRPGAPIVGHIDETATVLKRADLSGALGLDQIDEWGSSPVLDEALYAILAHHGRPADLSDPTAHVRWWTPQDGFDPEGALRELAAAAREAYPLAFTAGGPSLPHAPAFWQAIAGLLMLADWLGSDETAFPFAREHESDRISFARSGSPPYRRDRLRHGCSAQCRSGRARV
jgi:CRISPR-associated endonuclease/helicase Cas3